ncbi:hypothetical protein C8Q77DRAFT_1137588 [Trametes polyzona]|nr:hypothetical protein C8Q77DRAFT_1137588 [Trametes polyzona]
MWRLLGIQFASEALAVHIAGTAVSVRSSAARPRPRRPPRPSTGHRPSWSFLETTTQRTRERRIQERVVPGGGTGGGRGSRREGRGRRVTGAA